MPSAKNPFLIIVEIHANLIDEILARDIKQKPPYVLGAEVMVLLLIGLLLALLLPLLSPVKAILLVLAAFVGAVGFNLAIRKSSLAAHLGRIAHLRFIYPQYILRILG